MYTIIVIRPLGKSDGFLAQFIQYFFLNPMICSLPLIQLAIFCAAIRGYALGYLAGSAERIKTLMNSPGMIALDLELPLKELISSISDCLDKLPKFHNETALSDEISLSVCFRP